ncbi:MAG: hypothetical protein E6I45_00875 [Chloroflexi bacterium]|nr:MAG: hypothetical protein E6I45_00875 [Chloroflexota bacterium]
MTNRESFSQEQWLALVDAGPAIARAIASTAGSSGQTETELGAFVQIVEQAAADAPAGLLGDIVADTYGRLAGGLPDARGSDPYMGGIEAARKAGAILDVQPDPAEAQRARAWYLSIAQRVAEATREGGVLGIGGEQVSQFEREAIKAIADALGATAVDEGEAPAD